MRLTNRLSGIAPVHSALQYAPERVGQQAEANTFQFPLPGRSAGLHRPLGALGSALAKYYVYIG